MTETGTVDRPSVAKPASRPRSRKAATVSALALALHLNCSRTYIGKLAGEGVIQRRGDGFFARSEPSLPTCDADPNHAGQLLDGPLQAGGDHTGIHLRFAAARSWGLSCFGSLGDQAIGQRDHPLLPHLGICLWPQYARAVRQKREDLWMFIHELRALPDVGLHLPVEVSGRVQSGRAACPEVLMTCLEQMLGEFLLAGKMRL
jgi:hypothetical protein